MAKLTQDAFSSSAKRLVKNIVTAASADLAVVPNVSLTVGGKNIKEYIGNPYGIIPFAMSASREELIEAALAFETAKYELIRAGDYYKAWLYGRRQRMIEGVLTGMTQFKLSVLK